MAEKSKGGRPPHRPTLEQRQTVEEMKFCGDPDTIIARAIGIDTDTLRKHYEDELADGHAHRRKEITGLMFKGARAGNASLIKKLDEIGRAAGAAESIDRRGRTEERPAKLGVKEQRQQAAEAVTGKFTPPEAPRLVVSNGG